MTIIEARGLSDVELVSKKRDAREEIFNLRLQQQTGRLEKPSRLRELKRSIAHIETALSERRLGLKIESKIKAAPAASKNKATKSAAADSAQ